VKRRSIAAASPARPRRALGDRQAAVSAPRSPAARPAAISFGGLCPRHPPACPPAAGPTGGGSSSAQPAPAHPSTEMARGSLSSQRESRGNRCRGVSSGGQEPVPPSPAQAGWLGRELGWGEPGVLWAELRWDFQPGQPQRGVSSRGRMPSRSQGLHLLFKALISAHFPCRSQKLVQKTHVQSTFFCFSKALQPVEGNAGSSASNIPPGQRQRRFQAGSSR